MEFIAKLPEDFCENPDVAYTLPKAYYTSDTVFEHEKEEIFYKTWLCMAHAGEVAKPNDYITRQVIGGQQRQFHRRLGCPSWPIDQPL